MRRRRRVRASRGLDLASARSWTREGEDVATRARTSNARAGDATDARRDARARCDDPTTRVEGNAGGAMGDCVGSRDRWIGGRSDRRSVGQGRPWWRMVLKCVA